VESFTTVPDIELAMSVLVDSAFAVPSEVKDLPTAVSLITRITGEDHNRSAGRLPQSQNFLLGRAQGR